MRLQLTVQRHGLPPVQVLWTLASAIRPPLLAAGNSITISQFLEQVNEVLPLESEDWGLEDYSVEVRGFECLHFSELNQVLREDDEVYIRPLQTHDLRCRKISGRHQIAADGRHLVDGVAFGRPFLRRADRPAIRIPPRKRRRIMYDDEDGLDIEEPNYDQQIIVRAGFDDTDQAIAGDESDDGEDFAPDDEEEEDLGAELEDLQNDLGVHGDAGEGLSQDDVQLQRTTRSLRSPKGLGLLQLLDENGRPFAGQYHNPLLDLYGQDEVPNNQPKKRARKRGTAKLPRNPSKNFRSILRDSSASPQRVSRRDSAGSNRSVRFENAEPATPATIRESEDSEDADDADFELGEMDESDKENAEPQVQGAESSDSFFDGSQSSSSTSSDNQLSDDETSSGSSSSDSSSDSEPEHQPSKDLAHKSETSETSSSGSSSSSSSDSEPEPPKTGQKRKRAVQDLKSKKPADEAPFIVKASAPATTAPGKGSNQTRSRNQRKKESKRLSYIKSKGILPAAANKADLYKFEKENVLPERQEMIAVGGVRAVFEAKRQDLLTSIAAGGIDISPDPSLVGNDARMIEEQLPEEQLPEDDPLSNAAATEDTFMTDQPASAEGSGKAEAEISLENDLNSTAASAEEQDLVSNLPTKAKEIPPTDSIKTTTTGLVPSPITSLSVEDKKPIMDGASSAQVAVEDRESRTTPAPDSLHRRSKLDVSGAKRMLFGSLGLRTPKTKDDESKTREKLMKDVRPIKEPHVYENIETAEDSAAAAGDESWKDKIDLRAIECCYEGIELSTPPFPFVQRWDPQQQRGYYIGNARKRRRMRRMRDNNDCYEGNSYVLQNKAVRLTQDDWPRQETEASTEKAHVETEDWERSHDDGLEDSIKANKQLLHETEDASADTLVEMEETDGLAGDLPTLPGDLSTLLSLTLDTAAKGNIVAFKQLEMSAKTKWQPKISGYRTAVVDAVLDDGTLSMTLAKRDRPSKDMQYDEQTGERLYAKFEMPGYHDETGEDNKGKIEILFDELISPVLLECAGKNGNLHNLAQAQDHGITHSGSNDKAIVEDAHHTDANLQGATPDGPKEEIHSEEAAEPSEETRQEISELIKDAGWRSSVRFEVNHELIDRQDEGPPSQEDDLNKPELVDPPTPEFHHFNSSQSTNGFQVASSPPPAVHQTGRLHASGFEIAESVPPGDSPARSIISNHTSAIDYPDLPQMGDESDACQQEAQDRSGLLEAEHQIASQDLTSQSSLRRSPSHTIASPILTSPDEGSSNLVHVFDGADSDESLPELFSQAFEKRVSQGREIKSESSEDHPISPPNHRKSKRNRRISSSQRESSRDWEPDSEAENEDDGASTPRPSQPVFSSQIVDLTISSDTVDAPDDSYHSYNDDDSYILPTGPGWVQKPRTSISRDGLTKRTTTVGSTRSRW